MKKRYTPLLLAFLICASINLLQAQTNMITVAYAANTNIPITKSAAAEKIKMFPNPAIGSVKIYVNSLQPGETGECIIYNTNGNRVVSNYVQNGTNQVLLGSLPAGMYFVKFLLHNNVIATKTLCVSQQSNNL